MARPIAALSLLTPAISILWASPAAAKPRDPAFIVTAGATDAPRGFLEMCVSDRTFCAPREGGGAAEIVTGAIAGSTAAAPRFEIPAAPPADSPPPELAPPFRFAAMTDLVKWPEPIALAVGAPPPLHWEQPVTVAPTIVFRFTLPPEVGASLCDTLAIAPGSTPAASQPAAQPAVEPVAVVESALSAERTKKLLTQVNHAVNRQVAQRTDLQLYGRTELWRRSGSGRGAAGDCEDIAIEKRYELVAAGFPADRLAFAVVYSRDAGLHTVLIARTGAGDVVLDNRTPYVRPWATTGYNWIALQSMADPMAWHRITRAENARA